MQTCTRRAPTSTAAAGARAAGATVRPAPPRRRAPSRLVLRPRASPGDSGGSGDRARQDKKTQEYIEGLKKAGVDATVAKKILETWAAAGGGKKGSSGDNNTNNTPSSRTDGGVDPTLLRRLFLKQSIAPLLAVGAQVVIDTTAAFFALNSGVLISLSNADGSSLGKSAAAAVATALAGYFFFGALIDLVTLGALLYALLKLGASPEALLAAVKAIAASPGGGAGRASGLLIADKAAAAVNAVKVAAALDAIATLVVHKGKGGGGASSPSSSSSSSASDTLRDLTAFLTLQRAEQKENFDPSALGITEKQAMDYALVFGEVDENEDGALSSEELRRLCATLGVELSPAEASSALAAIDGNGDGQVTFSEFAAWFCARTATKAGGGSGGVA
jgi:hypothetical protein